MAGEVVIDLEGFTVGEAEAFEEISGMTIFQLYRAARDTEVGLPMKAVKALIYLTKKREDPTFTLEQADEVGFQDWQWKPAKDEAPDPTTAGGPA